MSKSNQKKMKRTMDHHMADVLYQQLAQQWYAFAEVDGEVFISRVDEEIMKKRLEEEEFFHDGITDTFSPKHVKIA